MALTGLANTTSTQKLWEITHENGHKLENDEFLFITLKNVSCLKVVANRPGTPKLWTIAHENNHKMRNHECLVITHKTCIGSNSRCK